MRSASAALISFLANTTVYDLLVVDLYTFQLVDGTTYRYSATNGSLTVPSAGFPADCVLNTGANRTFTLGPAFSRSKVTTAIGVQPTTLKVDVIPHDADTIGAFTFLAAAQQKFFDGATVELDRFFAPSPAGGAIDTSLGCMIWFYGRVTKTTVGRSHVSFEISSLLNLLQVQQVPRRLFEAPCGFIYGDARCGYDRVAGKNALGTSTGIGQITVTVTTGSTVSTINLTAPITADYNFGTVTGATGANAGVVRTMYNNGSGSQIVLARDLPFVPAATDTFTVLPGCDHTLTGAQGCTGRQNTARYGGFPYIPPPELAI